MICARKLIKAIAAVRRPAHDAGRVASFYAKIAEDAARKGQCAFARRELARTKRLVLRQGVALKGARRRRRRR